MAQGYATALVFTDITGEPWPVGRVTVEKVFSPVEPPRPEQGDPDTAGSDDTARHMVILSPLEAHAHGNAIIELEGLDQPVALLLTGGDGTVDVRVDLRLPLAGPHADPRLLTRPDTFRPGDPLIAAFLTGHAPPEAERLRVEGGGWRDRAWRYLDQVYLRTPAHLLSPGPDAFERGTDGTTVYRLADTPFAVISREGERHRLAFWRAAATRHPGTSIDALTENTP